MKILGAPLGHPAFVRRCLRDLLQEHSVLLDRIPTVLDTQSAWSLLLFCAAARANYFTRVVEPELCRNYAKEISMQYGYVCASSSGL